MNSQVGIPVIVLSRKQDHVEAINKSLRDARLPVHCSWLSDLNDLPDALIQIAPEMILYFADEFSGDVAGVIASRNHGAPGVPLLSVRRQVDERIIAQDLSAGVQDVVSLVHGRRLQAVVARELRTLRLERAFKDTQVSATQYRKQVQALMDGSADAIAVAQEGIVVSVNPAWLELFGFEDEDALVGQPLMDLFETESHTILKGALVAVTQGKWDDQTVHVEAEVSDGSSLPLDLQLEMTRFDGDPAVQICVPRERADQANPEVAVTEMLNKDSGTGLYHRRALLEAIEKRLGDQVKGGVRALAWVRPDKLLDLRNELGPLRTEALLDTLARLIAAQLGATDLAGRATGNAFAVLLERGTMGDCEAWTNNLLQKIATEVFDLGERSLSLTCSAGLSKNGRQAETLDQLLDQAERCCRQVRSTGGNALRMPDAVADDTRAMEQDQIWVRRIKAALMENRFRLVHQPIASLQDSHQGLYDMLVRMIGEDGSEILPGEFMPAAQRNRLMKNIDRWVIGSSMAFAISRKPSRVFVRLSADTLQDPTLPAWLQNQLRNSGAQPQRLCFQLTEDVCHHHLKESKAMAGALRRLGFQFAVEHFGTGRDPMQVLRHIPMNYVKIDGSLMQGLARNEVLQQKVRELVTAAREHKVLTIAERVEDANTMAVLFQLGVSYMQGHYIQEPDVVLEDTTMLRTIA